MTQSTEDAHESPLNRHETDADEQGTAFAHTRAMQPLTMVQSSSAEGEADCAVLSLRAGASPFPCWKFGELDRGLQIVIGSDPHCDWRILSAGVREQELQVFFSGRTLMVRSMRPSLGARVNGVRLDAGWVPLQNDARLEIGLACITVSTSSARGPPTVSSLAARDHAARVDDWERERQQAEQAAAAAEAEAEWEAKRWRPDARSKSPHPNDLASQQTESLSPPPELVYYFVYVMILGLAYAGWLLLLDHIGG